MKTNQTICFVAGKSGGHIIPCLTIAEQYKKQHPHACMVFFSSNTALDTQLLHNHPLLKKHLSLATTTIWHLICLFFKSLYHLHKLKPEKVISTGGLVSVPVCIAAKLIRIPIELHEPNAAPGRAIKFLAPLAQSIYVCFKNAQQFFPKDKCRLVPYPIRLTEKEKLIAPHKARIHYKLDPHRKTIFVLGGSQGSLFINNVIKQLLEENEKLRSAIQVIHQTGSHDKTNWHEMYQQYDVPAHVFSYTNSLAGCYAAADLVISRAGAGTLFETLFFQKPCITIPLEIKSTNHQLDNARAMAQEYPALFCVLRQQDISKDPSLLAKYILENSTGPKSK